LRIDLKHTPKAKKQLLGGLAKRRHRAAALNQVNACRRRSGRSWKPGWEAYRILADNASEAILVLQDGKFRYINKKAAEITGYTQKELSLQVFTGLIHPLDQIQVSL